MAFKHALAFIAASAAAAASAQTYPTQRVTLIVPFGPRGPNDVVSRAIVDEVANGCEQPFVLEFRPGAAGLAGAEYVTRQKPDGHTLLIHGSAPLFAKLFMKQVPYDPADLRAIASLGTSSFAIAVPP